MKDFFYDLFYMTYGWGNNDNNRKIYHLNCSEFPQS